MPQPRTLGHSYRPHRHEHEAGYEIDRGKLRYPGEKLERSEVVRLGRVRAIVVSHHLLDPSAESPHHVQLEPDVLFLLGLWHLLWINTRSLGVCLEYLVAVEDGVTAVQF